MTEAGRKVLIREEACAGRSQLALTDNPESVASTVKVMDGERRKAHVERAVSQNND